MKETFNQIEAKLKSLIEENTAKLFASADAESRLAERLVEAMQSEIRNEPDGSILAPDVYTIWVNPTYVQDVRSNQSLLDSLAQTLEEAGENSGIRFLTKPTITVAADPDVPESEFRIQPQITQEPLDETQAMEIEPQNDELQTPPNAFLIVGGTKIFSLEGDVTNIGRKLSNELVIEDVRVSRNHAQIRAAGERHILFDLNSSGGTFVNGERISEAPLHPGDVISIAGIPLVYGQDSLESPGETQEYMPPSGQANEGTTDNLNTHEGDW